MPKMSNYPSAQDAISGQEQAGKPPMGGPGGPEAGAPPAGPEAMGKDNPVFSALRTVAQWVSSMQEKGDPKAEQVVAAFKGLLEALGAGGAMEEQAPPEAAPAPGGPMPAKNMDSVGGGKGQAMGMAGMNKNAKVM